MSVPGSLPSLGRQTGGLIDENGDKSRSSAADSGAPHGSSDNTSATIPVPNEIQYTITTISSTLDKCAPVERHQLVLIVAVICVETAFLKWIRRSDEDVLSTIFFTILLGSFAWPVWSNLQRVRYQLYEVFGKLEALQQSIKVLESTIVARPPIECVPMPAVSNDRSFLPREEPTSKPNAEPIAKEIDAQPERPVEHPVATDNPPCAPFEVPPMPQPANSPAIVENPPSAVAENLYPTVIENPSLSISPAASRVDRGHGIQLDGMDNIIGVPDVGTASSPTEQPTIATERGSSPWSPVLREIKLRIEQYTEGRIERISHLDQGKPSNILSLRRWGVRLLMSAASLSPGEFAPSVGYLGPPESTPYYPSGDLRDRSVAFTIAMNCLDDLKVNVDDVQIAMKLFELAQALSDLGLHGYALNISGYASDALERLCIAEPNQYRLRLASILSLRANILFDLNRNEEARTVADRAVTLCKEQRDSQVEPILELAYALLNYAVLLCSMGFKDESAAVAFEILCEDETQLYMKDIFVLCKLCLSNTRIGADDDMGLEMAEELINFTCMSSDADSQTVLAGALLVKSKILSSREENDIASAISAEAVTLLRRMSAVLPVFTLFLAHALDVHAHHLSEAMRKAESYSIRREAVELWQTLKITAASAVARSLAWSLFKLALFRSQDDDKNARREELRLAESAVDAFREVVPLDLPGLGKALYNAAARMLELDNNREASTYAEESVQYFRDASAEDPKYTDVLIASLSLASSCLACTERADDAFEYAKQAVRVQHERKGVNDEEYNGLLRKLLADVIARASEIDKEVEVFPWVQELQALGGLGDSTNPSPNLNGKSRNTPTPAASSPTPSSSPSVDEGKGRKANSLREPSPRAAAAAAAQSRPAVLEKTGPPQGNMFAGGGPGGNDLLSGLLGAGRGRGVPGVGSGSVGHTAGGSGIPGLGMGGGSPFDAMAGFGRSIGSVTGSLSSRLSQLDFSSDGAGGDDSTGVGSGSGSGGHTVAGSGSGIPSLGMGGGSPFDAMAGLGRSINSATGSLSSRLSKLDFSNDGAGDNDSAAS